MITDIHQNITCKPHNSYNNAYNQPIHTHKNCSTEFQQNQPKSDMQGWKLQGYTLQSFLNTIQSRNLKKNEVRTRREFAGIL